MRAAMVVVVDGENVARTVRARFDMHLRRGSQKIIAFFQAGIFVLDPV